MKPTTHSMQSLDNSSKDKYIVAEKYYAMLSIVNGLHITDREKQLLAFTAIKGDITTTEYREEFCKKFDTTMSTINNMVSRLKKMRFLVKDDNNVIRVNEKIALDFSGPIVLNIKLQANGI